MIQDSIGLDSLRNNLLAVRRTWRAWRGQDLLQRPQMRCQTLTLGSDGSAWSICRSSLSSQSVVYSVGVGEEISFDLELIHRFGVTVHAFDPTPRSIAWVQSRPLPPEFVFHSYGIAGQDGMRRFVPPANQNFVSHTLLERETPWRLRCKYAAFPACRRSWVMLTSICSKWISKARNMRSSTTCWPARFRSGNCWLSFITAGPKLASRRRGPRSASSMRPGTGYSASRRRERNMDFSQRAQADPHVPARRSLTAVHERPRESR
jgi:hypothetical protein